MIAFWIFMFVCMLLVPLVMIGFGRVFRKRPPKSIQAVYGYRTARSMKNRDTWEFAHHYCGRVWEHWGWGLFAVTVAAMLLCLGKDVGTVGIWSGVLMVVQIAVMLLSIVPVERALKREFDEFGRRRG